MKPFIPTQQKTTPINWASPMQKEGWLYGPYPQVASGGWGSGKTWLLCMKALYLSTIYRRNRGVIARHIGSELRATTMATFFKVCPPQLYDRNRGGRRNDQHGYVKLRAPFDSEILFIHLDDPETEGIIRGLEINWFFIDQAEENAEQMEEIFDLLLGRLGRWDVAEVPQIEQDRFALEHDNAPWPFVHPESNRPVPPPYPMLACLEASTLVECVDGSFVSIAEACATARRIRSVRLSDGADVFERPSQWQRRWSDDGVTVATSAASLTATADHPFFRFNPLTGLSVVRADELRAGDFVPSPRENVSRAETRFDPDLAYLFGYTVGDGNLAPRRIQWADTAADQVARVKAICLRLFGAAVSVHKFKDKSGWYFYLPSKSTVQRLSKEFPELAIVGSEKKRVPVAITRADDASIAQFLSGLFDADGTAGPGAPANLSLCTTSRQLAHEVVLLLARLDILATLSTVSARGRHQATWHVSVCGAEAVRFAAVVGFRIDHKRAVTQRAGGRAQYSQRCVPLSARDTGGRPRFQRHQQTAPRPALEAHRELDVAGALRFGWQRVKSITPTAVPIEVYDITMPTEHNFVANGVVVHNCNPDTELHWIYRRFHEESEEFHREYKAQNYKMFHMPSEDNKFLGEANRKFLLAHDEAFVRRNVHGLWGSPEGSIHFVSKSSIVKGTPAILDFIRQRCLLFRTMDHGDSAPTCVLWSGVDRSGNIYIYREYYMPNEIVSRHRKNVFELSEDERYELNLADPSIFTKLPQRKGGKWSTADEWGDVLEQPRHTAIFWQPADNNELGTRNRINEYLRVDPDRINPFTGLPGSPRLFFIQVSNEYPQGVYHCLRETKGQRRVKIGTSLGKPVYSDERNPNIADHGYDPVRYLVASRAPVPANSGISKAGTFIAAKERLEALNRRRMGVR